MTLSLKYKDFLSKYSAAAIVKFCECIRWDNSQGNKERNDAVKLLNQWVTPDILIILRLLHIESLYVRKFAVDQLKNCSDKVLERFLLQLVQAIRFEGRFLEENDNNSANPQIQIQEEHEELAVDEVSEPLNSRTSSNVTN